MAEHSKFIVTLKDDRVFITVTGEGTFRIAGELKKACSNLLLEGFTNFTLDLKECTLLDSTFLGILLGLALKLKDSRSGGALHVANANSSLQELIKNLGLDKIVIFETS
jgi:anti-anti-sigma factor